MIRTREQQMKLTPNDIENLRGAFAVCRIAGIDAAVITDGKVRGVTPTSKMAMISDVGFSFDADVKIGIGRIAEFEKRLSVFSGNIEGEAKVNEKNEVSLLTLRSGKSSIQFRCTSEKLIKYPKKNEDPEECIVRASKAEIAQISRAVKSLGAETLTLAIGRDGAVKFECSAPTNEAFSTEIAAEAAFENGPKGIVHIYEGDRFASVLDASVRDADEVLLVLGEGGSISLSIKGHVLIALPDANQEEDDE